MDTFKNISVETPEVFDFPFPPYEIQQLFMKTLYNCLEARKLGIFESPTGTVRITEFLILLLIKNHLLNSIE